MKFNGFIQIYQDYTKIVKNRGETRAFIELLEKVEKKKGIAIAGEILSEEKFNYQCVDFGLYILPLKLNRRTFLLEAIRKKDGDAWIIYKAISEESKKTWDIEKTPFDVSNGSLAWGRFNSHLFKIAINKYIKSNLIDNYDQIGWSGYKTDVAASNACTYVINNHGHNSIQCGLEMYDALSYSGFQNNDHWCKTGRANLKNFINNNPYL